MKNDNQNKKKIVISISAILLLILITIGVTVALFTYTRLGTTENTITTGTLKFLYLENTGVGAGISMTNAFPVADDVGKEYDTENYVFDFSIEATNTGNEAIPYEVTLRKKSDSTLNENNVKIYLTDMTGDADTEIVTPTLYSNLIQTQVDVGNEVEKTLYEGTVNGGELIYEKNFRLRMWIKEDADYNEIAGQTFTAMVNVYSNVPLVEDSVVANGAEIKSIKVSSMNATKVEGQAYDYDLVLNRDLSNITIDVELDNPNATVDSIEKIDSLAYHESNIKRLAASENFNVEKGYNYFKITVTSKDNTSTSEYKLRVEIPDKLVNKIMNLGVIDKEPTLTTSSHNTSDPAGLYKSTETNNGSPTYYFRGDVENNYVDFAGFTWRVVRVNEDGTIRIVKEDEIVKSGDIDGMQYIFNNYGYMNDGSDYNYMYYTNSDIKPIIETWYQENIIDKGYSDKVATPNNYFCEQAKVTWSSDYIVAGNSNMIKFSDYIANFKCEEDGNGYGIVNESVGLLNYDEVVHAGAYPEVSNENFYLYFYTTWLTSPSGGITNNTFSNWHIGFDSIHAWSVCCDPRTSSQLRPVINLKMDTLVTKEGTADSHWIVQ